MSNLRIRSIVLGGILLAFAPYTAEGIGVTSTFQFVGNCTDCTGTGTATLVLLNYTQGNPLTLSNFVSLTYSSNLVNFTLLSGEANSVSGSIPASLPAPATTNFFGPQFRGMSTSSSGAW